MIISAKEASFLLWDMCMHIERMTVYHCNHSNFFNSKILLQSVVSAFSFAFFLIESLSLFSEMFFLAMAYFSENKPSSLHHQFLLIFCCFCCTYFSQTWLSLLFPLFFSDFWNSWRYNWTIIPKNWQLLTFWITAAEHLRCVFIPSLCHRLHVCIFSHKIKEGNPTPFIRKIVNENTIALGFELMRILIISWLTKSPLSTNRHSLSSSFLFACTSPQTSNKGFFISDGKCFNELLRGSECPQICSGEAST